MKLFDKRFVHFMWDNELKGKKCFLSDSIDVLKTGVEQMWSRMCFKVIKGEDSYPFGVRADGGRVSYRFAYYDPNYGVKRAFNEGKEIQFQSADGEWNSIVGEDMLKWYIEEGCKLRVKPECPCTDGIDSKAGVGCEYSEDGKPHPFENYHCYGCDKSSKKGYRPYETVHEFIQDYQDRFPTTTPRPCYTLPFIWLRNKNKKDERELVYCFRDLVIKMDNTYWDMNDLFDQWEYLDGSPVGMEVKE